ncbi:MAG: 8-amino-7-oxononanoate synthase [Verrucomicrobia bacterium]|nr:8-amino-7-oxononanoate synthase [Verrucomicrobiota bacterium]
MILHLEQRLVKRATLGNIRELRTVPDLIDFASNDYLGLARLYRKWEGNCGSTGSRLLTGNTAFAEDLEDQIAQFHGYEAGLLFNCGYMANLGLISTIGSSNSTLLFDSHIHASMRDGIRLSSAKGLPFRHNDLEHLENRLRQCNGNCFICIESIYSTDGSIAPLPAIADLACLYEACLIVDEAHAVGVMGPQGRGLVAEHHLGSQVFAQVVTFGKALGAYGAIVLGSDTLKAALVNFATPFIYTTAPPLSILSAIKDSYNRFPMMEKERAHLRRLMNICGTKTPILGLPIGGNEKAKQASKVLQEKGFDVRPLLSPTVQRGREVLRITLHAFNKEKELYHLCRELSSLESALK